MNQGEAKLVQDEAKLVFEQHVAEVRAEVRAIADINITRSRAEFDARFGPAQSDEAPLITESRAALQERGILIESIAAGGGKLESRQHIADTAFRRLETTSPALGAALRHADFVSVVGNKVEPAPDKGRIT